LADYNGKFALVCKARKSQETIGKVAAQGHFLKFNFKEFGMFRGMISKKLKKS